MRAAIDNYVGGGGVTGNQMDEYKRKVQQMQHQIRVRRSSSSSRPKTTYHAPKRSYTTVSALNPKHYSTTVNATPVDPLQAYKDQINKLYDQRLSSQLADFKANRDKAISGINGQIKGVQQDFYGKRNQADTVAQQNAQRLREAMANAGILSSGENVSANVGLNSARQSALNQLNTMEGQQVGGLKQQITDLNNPDRLNAIKQQIEADRAQALAGGIQHANDQAFNQNQFDQTMGWNYWNANHQDAQAQAQALAQIQAYQNMIQQLGGNFTNGSGGGERYQSDLAQAVQRAGIPSNQLGAFNWIIQHESSFNPNAKNPNSSAYGYGQFLDSTRRNYEKKYGLSYNDPVNQLILTYRYMVDRYGSPQNAMAFWAKNHWY